MDPELKKKLSNEKRLRAVQQQWHQNKNLPKNVIDNTHKIFDSPTKSVKESKLTLFDSDGEEDNLEDDFKIRPQFEGKSGQHLLEISSQFSERFKLDERFKDDDEPVNDTEENEEKVKNFKVLESILGYEVNEKFQEERYFTKRKSIMRFDPEDESSSKYLKTQKISEEKPAKKIKKDKKEEIKVTEEIPTNSERYVEVSKNLKDLFGTSTSSFSLTSRFSSNNQTYDDDVIPSFTYKSTEPKKKVETYNNKVHYASQKTRNLNEKKSNFYFFITENDNRLKEGVEFFQRTKSLDEVREDWLKVKDQVEDLFVKEKKSNEHRPVKKVNASQRNKMFAKKQNNLFAKK